jgi:hypothetical protein
MKIIADLHYCGNIEYFTKLSKASEIRFEVFDHFEKQTFRNRTVIYGANGPLKLTVPLVRKGIRTPIHEVTIDNTDNWKTIHWRSLESAYRSSPYFEFYEDHFEAIYKEEYTDLLTFNKALMEKIFELLKLDIPYHYSTTYEKIPEGFTDLRKVIHPRKNREETFPKTRYIQVFEDKAGFLPNLSILDLLFNEGPNSVSYF